MNQPKSSTKARAPRKLLNARRFPSSAQTEASAGREKVREVAYPVRAPRQSERRGERTGKRRTGT
jgi:hypothetical protein